MVGRERQIAGLEWADLGEQVAAWHGVGWYRQRAQCGTGSRHAKDVDRAWRAGGVDRGGDGRAGGTRPKGAGPDSVGGRAERDRDAGMARAGTAGLRAV